MDSLKMNLFMIGGILKDKFITVSLIIISIDILLFGFNASFIEPNIVIMQEKMPDGKIYIEYHFEQTAIKTKVVKRSEISSDGKIYNRIDYSDKALIFFCGFILGLVSFASLFQYIKISKYIIYKREMYNIDRVQVHYRTDRLLWVYDEHIMVESPYMLDMHTLLAQMQLYHDTKNGFKHFKL
jgi:hypothetical protein